MAIDTSTINNVGEFYSDHYLDAILDKDVKSYLKTWEENEGGGYVAPHKRLSALSNEFFKLKSKLSHLDQLDDKFGISHAINVALTEALGFTYMSGGYELGEDNQIIPVLASVKKDGNPYLWIVESYWDLADDARLFDQTLLECQKPPETDDYELPEDNWEHIPSLIFKKDEPPRWLILLAGGRALLIERHKWGQGQYLEFDLDEIMSRKNIDNFKAVAVLLSKEAILPDDSNTLHDALDENSHKHAYAVSSDLKYGIRRAVELLANEYVWYVKNHQDGKGLNKAGIDKQLTKESLTYMYRLLFLLYAEARSGDLGLLPMNSDEYRMGYSMESLRDLEQIKLTSEKSQNGYFFNETLKKLFHLINDGHTPSQITLLAEQEVEYESVQSGMFGTGEVAQGRLKMSPVESNGSSKIYTDYEFTIEALGSPLFDPEKTPLLSKGRYRNKVLQEIVQLLSLSKQAGRKGRGRISYAQLGINQLGAVYEGLLSYTGFFAKETLYEVKKADDASEDENRQAYFIPESEVGKYDEDEFVTLPDPNNPEAPPRKVKYDEGTFIYRLAGRDREKSASYYTPEVLTKAVVKYSLKELLKDKTADEILDLTICEPAMGSGAFLNEAVNQLADAYLKLKQKEVDDSILPGEYQQELQRVKAHIASRNCYGVDLNPTAVDLAKVSLWLNIIYSNSKTPWFNMRLSAGNSLIGARLQVFKETDLLAKRGRGIENFIDKVPEKVDISAGRPEDGIYHFFVPDEGMAGFDKDRVIKDLLPVEVQQIKDWRKSFTKEFSEAQTRTLKRLSGRVDELLDNHLESRERILQETDDQIPVWPEKGKIEGLNINVKEKREQSLYEGTTAYRKLKLVMDYWCSLWFWPIQKADELPTRDQFIRDMELILEGETSGVGRVADQLEMGYRAVTEKDKAEAENIDEFGVDDIIGESHRLQIVAEVSQSSPFMHWELQYYEVFKQKGGFDLIVGNPPWVKLEWSEKGVLGDFEPLFNLRNYSSNQISNSRISLFNNEFIKEAFVNECGVSIGSQNFLNSGTNYHLLLGQQTNLYKCFVHKSFRLLCNSGIASFLHPDGIYDDPKGGIFRKYIYPKLKYHFQFYNELKLFPEVHNETIFSINIYSNINTDSFNHISNLFHPNTIDESYIHDGSGIVDGIKNNLGKWNIRGHMNRIIKVDDSILKVCSKLFEEKNADYLKSKLPSIHTIEISRVLQKYASQTIKLGDFNADYYSTIMFDETYAQRDGMIIRNTNFPDSISDWIVSGPHLYVGNPCYKTPRRICNTNKAYDLIDLTNIVPNYLPRTNYLPNNRDAFNSNIQNLPWNNSHLITDKYRLITRKMIGPSAERTLIAAIFPPGVSHIHGCFSLTFKDLTNLLIFASLFISLPIDFFVKTTGKSNFLDDMASKIPSLDSSEHSELIVRTLMLHCLTEYYFTLWTECWSKAFLGDKWCKSDIRLDNNCFSKLSSEWNNLTPLRTDYERYHALVEIDVLVSQSLGLKLEELLTIYRVQFPVMQQYERDTWYDQKGRIVFTISKGLSGVGFSRTEWNQIKDMQSGTVERTVTDDTQPVGPVERTITYEAPFDRCDREEDYRIAWAEFERRLAKA